MRYCFLPAAFDCFVNSWPNFSKSSLRGLFHQVEHAGVGVFGGDFQMPADVMLRQFAHVNRIATGQIHANARGDQHFFHAGKLAGLFHQVAPADA